jgi:hypothetical protein
MQAFILELGSEKDYDMGKYKSSPHGLPSLEHQL